METLPSTTAFSNRLSCNSVVLLSTTKGGSIGTWYYGGVVGFSTNGVNGGGQLALGTTAFSHRLSCNSVVLLSTATGGVHLILNLIGYHVKV